MVFEWNIRPRGNVTRGKEKFVNRKNLICGGGKVGEREGGEVVFFIE